MASPGVEIVGGPWGSILELSRASQLSYNNKSKKWLQKYTNIMFTVFFRILPWVGGMGEAPYYKNQELNEIGQ